MISLLRCAIFQQHKALSGPSDSLDVHHLLVQISKYNRISNQIQDFNLLECCSQNIRLEAQVSELVHFGKNGRNNGVS